jgi:hypothetical protein
LEKYGLFCARVVAMGNLTFSKASFSIDVNLNCVSFLIICWRSLTISAKSNKSLHEIDFSKKRLHDFLFLGKGICMIDLICSRSIEIPYLEMICHNNFPSETKILSSSDLVRFHTSSFQNLFQMVWMISSFLGIHCDFIKIDHHTLKD